MKIKEYLIEEERKALEAELNANRPPIVNLELLRRLYYLELGKIRYFEFLDEYGNFEFKSFENNVFKVSEKMSVEIKYKPKRHLKILFPKNKKSKKKFDLEGFKDFVINKHPNKKSAFGIEVMVRRSSWFDKIKEFFAKEGYDVDFLEDNEQDFEALETVFFDESDDFCLWIANQNVAPFTAKRFKKELRLLKKTSMVECE